MIRTKIVDDVIYIEGQMAEILAVDGLNAGVVAAPDDVAGSNLVFDGSAWNGNLGTYQDVDVLAKLPRTMLGFCVATVAHEGLVVPVVVTADALTVGSASVSAGFAGASLQATPGGLVGFLGFCTSEDLDDFDAAPLAGGKVFAVTDQGFASLSADGTTWNVALTAEVPAL